MTRFTLEASMSGSGRPQQVPKTAANPNTKSRLENVMATSIDSLY
jgi:hypothetical protein